ncbi:Myb-like, SWIRM and MPN domains 1 [Apophysomyces ossiformis]|uniref:Myb-like, SWIRM and MPN domains 1 n=1 Tax=Apophysomyces ossiformis TaxID=679940 RepID=A0A8H7ETE0_9FUNG|nr:Myb-like, SWIRM and MPN domains 1 [Apophysomyces ossiformis]
MQKSCKALVGYGQGSIDHNARLPGTKTEPDHLAQPMTMDPNESSQQKITLTLSTSQIQNVKNTTTSETQAAVLTMETNKEQEVANGNNAQTKSPEKIIDKDTVSAEEKRRNPEWFCNKPAKTPERYMKIRNYILDCWENCRPEYLTKTGARRGLRNCGDVNAIGRVHAYLESIGAINVNCVAPSTPRPTRRAPRKVYDYVSASDDESMTDDLTSSYRASQDKYFNQEVGIITNWNRAQSGRNGTKCLRETFDFLDGVSRPKRVIKRPQHYYDHDGMGSSDYDPFRLVPLAYYNDEYPAPFMVEIQSDALCEMDPESEMKAREIFAQKGYTVVGWYHSHPTFEPHPSVRDIENQTLYQTLFRDERTGDEPFIGIIVTPYDPEIVNNNQSKMQYLHISNRWNSTQSYRLPYACRRKICHNESQISPEVMERFKELVEEFKNYEHKIDMRLQFGIQTRLEKLLDSLQSHLYLCDDEAGKFLNNVRDLITNVFMDAPIHASGKMMDGMASSNAIDSVV